MGRGKVPPPVPETGPSEISTLSRAFNQMAADLKRLDDERALLLAGVSHDLRTPLSRIRLGLEMLDDKGDAVAQARAWRRTSRTSTPRSASSSISRAPTRARRSARTAT